jgi:hypothetical protein
MIASTVRGKGLTNIMGQDALHSISLFESMHAVACISMRTERLITTRWLLCYKAKGDTSQQKQ